MALELFSTWPSSSVAGPASRGIATPNSPNSLAKERNSRTLALIALMGSAGLDFSKLTTGMGEVGVLMSGKIYPTITAADLIIRAILVVVIAAIASLYPAWQASRKEPSKALHHV